MPGILEMIDEALDVGFSEEELSDMVNAIQDENIAMMERRARTRDMFRRRPVAVVNGEIAWDLGNGRYVAMTNDGGTMEMILQPGDARPKRIR